MRRVAFELDGPSVVRLHHEPTARSAFGTDGGVEIRPAGNLGFRLNKKRNRLLDRGARAGGDCRARDRKARRAEEIAPVGVELRGVQWMRGLLVVGPGVPIAILDALPESQRL